MVVKTYTTIQGETWDAIAFKVYGSETCATYLMENNYRYLDILVFSAGTVLLIPELPESKRSELPPWRIEETLKSDPYDKYDEEESG